MNEVAEIHIDNLQAGDLLDVDMGWHKVVAISVVKDETEVTYLKGKRNRKVRFPPNSRVRTIDEHLEVPPEEPDSDTAR